MAESFVAWVDYSSAEQDRMRRAIALFKEHETRDELGLGMIRDALADGLFPGTSTVQTRLRYFLIIPWIYQELARKSGVTNVNVGQRVKKLELNLIEPLTTVHEEGVFGAISGRNIQRLPSSVYWNGLREWGILRMNLSQDEYHQRWDEIRSHNGRVVCPDDTGIAPDLARPWDQFPGPPPEWTTSLNLEITRPEAEYLRTRMESCKHSLLAHIASNANDWKPDLQTESPWNAIDRLPPKLKSLLDQAKAFALLMWGTTLLYSLDLCERSELENHQDLVPKHRESMNVWAAAAAETAKIWNPDELWGLLSERREFVRNDRPDRQFVEAWFDLAHERGTKNLIDDRSARRLVEDREIKVKGATRSRYCSVQARNRWAGSSGTALMDYRWYRVRRLLQDLYDGLERKAE